MEKKYIDAKKENIVNEVTKTTSEVISDLRGILPDKIDYASLICAEPFAYGQCFVYEDPESYFIETAIDRLEQQEIKLSEKDKRIAELEAENREIRQNSVSKEVAQIFIDDNEHLKYQLNYERENTHYCDNLLKRDLSLLMK